MAKARNLQNVDWCQYFHSIRQQCPWSWRAWQQDQIQVMPWRGSHNVDPLGHHWQARVYVCDCSQAHTRRMANRMNQLWPEDEWLWSYPGYGAWATTVPVLIQQSRARLHELRSRINNKSN